ncbi:MAG: hypothetical protein P8X57_10910 [Cyclobacteriaceae bacterium]
MKNLTRILTIIFLSLSLYACGEDDPSVPTYAIKVTNTTANTVSVFMAVDSDEVQFDYKGLIPSGEFREYTDLKLDVTYVLRASWEGEEADQFFNQHNITNKNPDIISLNFDIFE